MEILYDYIPDNVFEEFSLKHDTSIKMILEIKTQKTKHGGDLDESEIEHNKMNSNQKLKKPKVNEKLTAAAKNTKPLISFFAKK